MRALITHACVGKWGGSGINWEILKKWCEKTFSHLRADQKRHILAIKTAMKNVFRAHIFFGFFLLANSLDPINKHFCVKMHYYFIISSKRFSTTMFYITLGFASRLHKLPTSLKNFTFHHCLKKMLRIYHISKVDESILYPFIRCHSPVTSAICKCCKNGYWKRNTFLHHHNLKHCTLFW